MSIAQENDVVSPPTHDVDHDPLHETSCERQTHTVLRCPNAVPSSPPTSIILLSSRGGERALNEPRRGCLHLLISQMFWLWQELLFLGHAPRLTMTTREAIECELFTVSNTTFKNSAKHPFRAELRESGSLVKFINTSLRNADATWNQEPNVCYNIQSSCAPTHSAVQKLQGHVDITKSPTTLDRSVTMQPTK